MGGEGVSFRWNRKKAVLEKEVCNYDFEACLTRCHGWRGDVPTFRFVENIADYGRSPVHQPLHPTYLFADESFAVRKADLQVNLKLLLDVLHRGFLQIRVFKDLMQALDNRAVHFFARLQLLELGGHDGGGHGDGWCAGMGTRADK